MNALASHPELWNEFPIRTKHPGTAHADVSDVLVFFNPLDGDVANDREVIPFPSWSALPQIRPLVFDLMRRVEAVRLGRVIITKLPAGKTITPHVDGGAPAEYFTRYQIALQSLPGVLFRIGDECVQFQRGECWRIDNRTTHSVENNSADDRIVVIVDLRLA
jgi:aspartyl/asparaginyl beta-hydroxylase